MNRLMITSDSSGGVVFFREVLQKHPPGNAQQRAKAVRSGWKLNNWRTAEKYSGESIFVLVEECPWDGGPTLDVNPDEILHVPEIDVALSIASWAKGFVERDRASTEYLERLQNQRFCQQSGLL